MMDATRTFATLSWIALPTVMYGGYALRSLMERGNGLTPFQQTYFRAGHAHAGVLLALSLPYYHALERGGLPARARWAGSGLYVGGVLAQSGGFFLHLAVGKPGQRSVGTTVTTAGALALAASSLLAAYASTRGVVLAATERTGTRGLSGAEQEAVQERAAAARGATR